MDAAVNQKVSLGCGTLLLIALIVVIFSNSGTRGLDNEIRKLNQQVQALQSQANLQTQTIRSNDLDDELRKLKREVQSLANTQTQALESMNATLAEIKARLPSRDSGQ